MKLWNAVARKQTRKQPSAFALWRMCAWIIVLALAVVPFSSVSAADETALGITLDPVAVDQPLIVEGDTISIRAMASISGTSNKKDVSDTATWTSSSTNVKVNKGVLSATGAVDSATITAKYQGFIATVQVKSVYDYKELKLELVSGSSNEDAPSTKDVLLGDDIKLIATAVEDNNDESDVTEDATWSTSNAAVATVSDGELTLVSAGTATITVKHKGRTDTIALTVTSPYDSIKIGSATPISGPISMYVGDVDLPLTATATYKKTSDGTKTVTADATWTSSNSGVVKVEKGLITAVGAGTAIVTVKQYGVSDTVSFQVRTKYEAMKLTPNKPIAFTLYGDGVELQASVSKGTGASEPITDLAEWKTGDSYIAAIVKNKDGKVTVVPRSVGTTKVSVTYLGLTKEQTVTVYPSIVNVDIPKDQMDAYVEDTGSLPAVSGDTVGGDTQDISKLVQWTSSDATVVSIEDGKWKALKTGTAKLTATVVNEPGALAGVKTDTITVDVHNKVLSLDSDISAMSVVIGKEADLPPVKLIYENGDEEVVTDKVTWKASNANLLVKAPKIKGLKAANVTLTGTYLSKTVTVKVTIEEEFTSFQITPAANLQLYLNKSQTVKVTATTKSGKKVSIGTRLDWESSDPELVTINGASIKGLKEGTGKLKAAIQGKALEIAYTVSARMTKLTASDKSIKLVAVGTVDSVTLSADYDNGKSVDVTDTAVWTTSNKKVATVTGGTITFVGKGSATIKAVFEGKTVTVSVSAK
ncbi:Ig-like domain-containing protein [Cohnella yongneupensis]|uniref:Ig domain-containing protein n=1 Tax=Cohnella yongneupensis TaxID=425006 RepID=A0ABW0R0M6_9BACL